MNETYVTISGQRGGRPQVRRTRADVPFVTFRVASNVRRVDHKTGEYIDAGTNFVNVTAFRSLGINLANSLEKGHPVVVYGRMRINQWTNGERTGTTVEIDAYNVGHDLTRGQPRSSGWPAPARAARPAGRPGRAAGERGARRLRRRRRRPGRRGRRPATTTERRTACSWRPTRATTSSRRPAGSMSTRPTRTPTRSSARRLLTPGPGAASWR